MHGGSGMTVSKLVSGVVIGGLLLLLVALLLSGPHPSQELRNRTVCMSNLSGINKAIILYRSDNDNAFPWLNDKITAWDRTVVGTNRNVDPNGKLDDPNNPRPRSITALMFMLVRQDQDPGMFRCPSDTGASMDQEVKAMKDDGDVAQGGYYWDFAKPENVSYSYQAPIWKDGRFQQGADSSKFDTVVIADMTPAATNSQWKPADVSKRSGSAIEAQNSPNHKGKQVNILRVAGNVGAAKRPDVGIDEDSIYTASGDPNAGSRSATSLDIRKHLSPSDTFLIGPVGRSEGK